MKILHVMRSVDPEDGGPIEALVQADTVGRRLGHQRTIVSLDRSDDPWVARCPIETIGLGSRTAKSWQPHIPLLRYGFTPHLVPWLRSHVGDFDRVVVNGLWNYSTFAARCVLPFHSTPYFVFTHGMLDPWFRTAHPWKHRAKQLSWRMAEGPLLHGAAAVLFTSEAERARAAHAFTPYRFREAVAGYGTGDAPVLDESHDAAFRMEVPNLGQRPFLLFLGRLHPKKGCDLLLRAFAAQGHSTPELDLVMAGPDGAGWKPALVQLAASLGIADRVHWPGMLRGKAKWGALAGCEAFVLPSHGENFGIAVAEAMACGKPVLITDKINIFGAIAATGSGLVEPDSEQGVATLLERFSSLPAAARREMGARARACFLDRFLIDRVAESTLAILQGEGTAA